MRARRLVLALVVNTAFFGSLWQALPGIAAVTIGADAFLASPAAAAFKRGQFEPALEGFEALLADYPGDPVILHIGIALDRLERYLEAVEAFQKGLERAPDNAVLNFFLGISSVELRNAAETAARSRLAAIATLALPSSPARTASRQAACEAVKVTLSDTSGMRRSLLQGTGASSPSI